MRVPTTAEIDGLTTKTLNECDSCEGSRRVCSIMFDLVSKEARTIATDYDRESVFQDGAYERLFRVVDAVLRDAGCQLSEEDRLRNIGFPVQPIETPVSLTP